MVIRLAKIVLALVAAVGLALLILVLVLTAMVRERQTLARKALAKIAAKSGALVTIKRIDLGVSTRGLELVAHGVNVAYKGDHIRARRLLAVVGYSGLAHLRVLPLKSLELASAFVELAPRKSSSQPVDLRRYMAKLPQAAARLAHLSRHTSLMRLAIEPPGHPKARLALDLRIDANASRARVTVAHLAWNGAPLDGLSARAAFTVPSARAQAARGKIAFVRRAADLVLGRTTLQEAQPGALGGKINLALSAPSLPGRTGFAGTYSVRQNQIELKGALKADDSLGLGGPIPLQLALDKPFSKSPNLTAQAGPLEVEPASLASAMGKAAPAAAGSAEISSMTLALALAPVRSAVAGCPNAACETHRALQAIIRGAVASMTIASARLQSQRPGLGTLELNAPMNVTLRDGVAQLSGLNARAGAVTLKNGEFNADLRHALSSSGPSVSYSARLFSALDLGRLDLQSRMPPRALKMVPHKGVAYTHVSIDGTLANDGAGFKPQKLEMHLRQGFVQLRDRGQHETILFGGDGSLAGGNLICAVHASLQGGGTVLLNARYALARRAARARLEITALDLRRWTGALMRADAVSGLTIAGEANGSAALEWSPTLAQPRVSGRIALKALTVGSRFTKSPVFIPVVRILASNTGVRIRLEHAQVGAGNFSLHGSVANFAAPKIDIAVNGQGFDFDVLRTGTGASASGGRQKALAARVPARRVTLHATVRFKRVFVHHAELRDFACDIQGRGSRWEVTDLSAHAMQGALKMRAAWDARTGRVYVTADVYRMNVERLLARLSPSSPPQVSGLLSARLNAGLALAGGSQPKPLCGDSEIVMTDGSLGRVQVLSEIVQLVSVASWLRFNAPDLDAGMPYDRITVRTILRPHALEISHLQLSSDLLGLAGHGKVALPSRVLDLHMQALPLASVRWVLSHLPLAGARFGKALNRMFAVRIRVTGTANSPNVSPELFRNPLEALTDIVELPLDFVPDSDLPNDVLFKPPHKLSYRKNCSPYQW